MENKTLSLTDEIYTELVDGLKRGGLDWTQFLAKHGTSKGPLYNAIGRFFNDMEPKARESNEVQAKLDEGGLKLDSLNQKIKQAEGSVARLEDRKNTLNRQTETLETKLAGKSEFIKQATELEKLGFDIERLRQLQDALTEIGAKRGLKGKEAASKFFAELKDYDTKTGFEREIRRLETIAETKRLETEKWQADADSSARRHKDLSEAVTAVQSLIKQGVKTEQVVSWNAVVSKLGGPEELQDKLGQYRSMSDLLAARKKEMENYEKKIKELGAQIKVLSEQKVEIEGAIKSLSSSGVKEIANISDKAMTGLKSLSSSVVKEITEVSGKSLTELKSLSTSGVQEITKVGDKALTELKSLLAEIRGETKRLADLKAEAGKLEKELMYARYLTTGDQAVLKAFPKEVVIAFLERVSGYCQLNQVNPRVRALDGFSRKYAGIESYAEVELIDLIRWAEAGLAGAVQ